MTYQNGQIAAVSGSATALPQPGQLGYVLENLSTSTVAYCGGPGVSSTTGLALGTVGQAVVIPGRHVVWPGDTDDAIYVRTAAGTASIAYVIPG
jgi:hypothetical protein